MPTTRKSGIIPPVMLILMVLVTPEPLSALGSPVIATPGSVEVEVVDQWPGGLVLDLELHGMAAQPSVDHHGFHRLSIPGAGVLAEDGRPELPAVGRFVAVPRGARITLELLQGEEIPVPALRPAPYQPPAIDDQAFRGGCSVVDPDPAVYGNSAIFPARRATVERPRDIRGCRLALLKLFPVRYDPSGGSLLYTPRMRVRLLFEGGDGRFIDPRHRTPVFEKFFRALLLNADSLGPAPGTPGGPPPPCEMLIITPEIFETEAHRLAEWKNQRGIPTQVRTTAETGTTAAEITNWIHDRYHGDWPELSYLLFFGDVGEADSVPCHYITEHDYDGILVGTDLYYGVLDVEQGEQDYFPDLFMGRISVDQAQVAGLVVDKILEYERAPDTTGNWLDSVLLAAYEDPDPDRFFVITSQAIHHHLDSLGYSCNRQYEAGFPSGSTRGVLDAIDEGVFLVTHRDHGTDRNSYDAHTGWVHPEFTEEHVPQLANGNRLPVMMSVNCRSGWFDGETDGHSVTAESFCELLLRTSPGGVVGVIGDTRTSYSGYNDELLKGFIDGIWDQFDPFYPNPPQHVNQLPSPLYQMGAVLNFGKFWMYDKYIASGGEGYPWTPTDRRNRIQFEVFHYHGDPSMELWTGTPAQDWQVSYNPAFFGDTSFTVTEVYPDNALVAVSRDGVLIGRAFSSDNQAVVQFAEPLDQLGDLTLCITRHDQVPYLDTAVPVEIPDGPWVLYQGHQADDHPPGGNGDGWVSPGETVSLGLEMHNFGTAAARNVVVNLNCKSGLAEMLQGQSAYPDIEPGQTAVNEQPFSFRIAPGCPDGELITFTVSATDGVSTWESAFFIEVNGARITCYSHQVLDNLPGGGNQDQIADPGERVELRVSLRNTGLVYASRVAAQLTTTETLVTIEDMDSDFPNIAAGNIGTSFSPHFRVTLEEAIPCGTVVPFTLLVNADEGQSSTGFDLLVGSREVVFFDDMEEVSGNWSSELVLGQVDWEIVNTNPGGDPDHVWFSPGEKIDEAGKGEPPAKDNRLISPTFTVTRNASMRFRHRVVMEAGFDGCVLEISTDGGGSWSDLGTRITHGGYTHQISSHNGSPIAGRWAWSGTSGPSLTRVEVDLDDFAGHDAVLRFRLVCDTRRIPDNSGWSIDDLEVEGVICSAWLSPDETISMEMACTPVSATLPFTVTVQAQIHNDCNRSRLVAATLDLELASGYYLANLVTGSRILYPDQSVSWGINRIFPGHPLLVGINTFRLSAYDITPHPYNVPPDYPASGDTSVKTCDVECVIP